MRSQGSFEGITARLGDVDAAGDAILAAAEPQVIPFGGELLHTTHNGNTLGATACINSLDSAQVDDQMTHPTIEHHTGFNFSDPPSIAELTSID